MSYDLCKGVRDKVLTCLKQWLIIVVAQHTVVAEFSLARAYKQAFGPIANCCSDELSSKRSTRLTQMHRSTLEGNK